MAKLYDLARMTSATTGIAGTATTMTLGSAVGGYLSFASAGVANLDVVTYGISDGTNSEIGRGTYTSSGTTLSRDTIIKSTNSNAAIALSGSQQVYITAAAEDLLNVSHPQGRLTLVTGTAIMSGANSGISTVFYTPYKGQFVPIYDGVSYTMMDTGGEISQATTDATKSPAACTTNSNYDVFVWNDAGTIRSTRGPTWNAGAVAGSNTARGTGAGSTELQLVKGFWLNKNAITNGPGANRGTYVGSIRTNGTSTVDQVFGGISTQASLHVWNAYNREKVTTEVVEGTGSWTQSSATVGPLNGLSSNRIDFLSGQPLDGLFVSFAQRMTMPAVVAANGSTGFALDSTTAFDRRALCQSAAAATYVTTVTPSKSYAPQLGQHFIQALQSSDGTNTTTWNGSGVGTEDGLCMVWSA